jgi:hypothetical protein
MAVNTDATNAVTGVMMTMYALMGNGGADIVQVSI